MSAPDRGIADESDALGSGSEAVVAPARAGKSDGPSAGIDADGCIIAEDDEDDELLTLPAAERRPLDCPAALPLALEEEDELPRVASGAPPPPPPPLWPPPSRESRRLEPRLIPRKPAPPPPPTSSPPPPVAKMALAPPAGRVPSGRG